MSEITPLPSEDPLPLISSNRVGHPDFYPKKDKTLGEYVSTDPRDPFVWLASTTDRSREHTKQILWAIYRMNGSFPADDEYSKWRDNRTDIDVLFKDLMYADLEYIDRYQKHLAKLDAAEAEASIAVPEPRQLTGPLPYESVDVSHLHEPSPAALIAAAAILEHAYLVSGQSKDADRIDQPL